MFRGWIVGIIHGAGTPSRRRAAGAFGAAIILGLFAAGPARAVGEADYAGFVRRAIDFHVRSAYEGFAQHTELLKIETDALCAAPDEARLEAARRAFRRTVRSLATLEPVRYGPILQDHRQERLAFWPDARGHGMRQMQLLMAAKDPSALDPIALSAKSVGVQGLTAYEILTFDSELAPELLREGAWHCRYAMAIAANVDAIARQMALAWEGEDGAAAIFLEPGPSNPLFRNHREAAGKILAGMAAALDIMATQKLQAIIGADPTRARPRLAPYWRSGETFPTMAATLEATRHLFEVSGVVDLVHPGQVWMRDWVLFELGNAIRIVDEFSLPVELAMADRESRQAATYLIVIVSSMRSALGRELTAAVGLEPGFNAHDGD
jgi:uncharacterized protein